MMVSTITNIHLVFAQQVLIYTHVIVMFAMRYQLELFIIIIYVNKVIWYEFISISHHKAYCERFVW